MKRYAEREEMFGDEMREIERVILLRNVDSKWMEHLDVMDDLKGNIGLQAYAQRNPISEFRIAAADVFDEMISSIRLDTVRRVLTVIPRPQPIARVQIAKPLKESLTDGTDKKGKTIVVRKAEKVGRNDLCPCGSGKKYKKCCGAAQND